MIDLKVRKVVRDVIKDNHPELWTCARRNSYTDDAGNGIYVHPDSIVWETAEWVDYDVLDQINEKIEELNLDKVVVAAYNNSYEIIIEEL